MKWFPTRTAEKLYDVLVRYSEADPNYYSRETFIFHYGVCSDTSKVFKLTCLDGASRTFVVDPEHGPLVLGKGAGRTNAMIRKMMTPEVSEIGEFTVISNEI